MIFPVQEPHAPPYPKGSLGAVITEHRKVDASKGTHGYDEDKIRGKTNKKPPGGIIDSATGKPLTDQQLKSLPPTEVMKLSAHVVRRLPHKHLVDGKHHVAEQAGRFRMALGEHLADAKGTVADAEALLTTDAAKARSDTDTALASLKRLHELVEDHAERGRPLTVEAGEESDKLTTHVMNFLASDDPVVSQMIAPRIDAAHASLKRCVVTQGAVAEYADLAEKMRIAAHVSRHSSYAWLVKHVSSGMQKNGLQLLNQFGMITMIASTPLLFMSFKQMYDEFARQGPGAQQ